MASNEVVVVFHGDLLFWRTPEGFEILMTDSPQDHVYRFGLVGKDLDISKGAELWLKGVAAGDAALDGEKMFLLKGGSLTSESRAKSRAIIHVPPPKQILYMNAVEILESTVAWARDVPVGQFFDIPGYRGRSVSRPGGAFKTIVFLYDTLVNSQMWVEDAGAVVLTEPAHKTLRFIATGQTENSAHLQLAGNATAALVNMPPIFGLPGPNIDETATIEATVLADDPVAPMEPWDWADPSASLKLTSLFEGVTRHQMANRLSEAPGFALLEKRAERLIANPPVPLSDLTPQNLVDLATTLFTGGSDPQDADAASCAPLGGEGG